MNEEWRKVYQPIERIKESWYKDLTEPLSVSEWQLTLSETKNNTAPGVSGIVYPLIRQANYKVQVIFKNLAELCLRSGMVPDKWKISQIYTIPKGESWDYDLSKTRPIALLETFRKCVTRVLNRRLGKILKEKDILRGLNFAGLPGNSTEEPVHLLNMLIEEAASKKQELWLLFQNMKKAFDSVSLAMLKLSLERIKVPLTIIRFIINIFGNRKVKVITHFGLTKDFIAVDAIEQGEVLSPLIWRIFYDPLLWRIQNDLSVGYVAKVTKFMWSDIDREKDIRVSVLAYADDTTWIARSKDEMEKIIELANQFFRINNIEINRKKSKLAVLNSLKTKEDRNDKFGDAIVKAEENMSEIKFLEVYLHTKKELPIIKRRLGK